MVKKQLNVQDVKAMVKLIVMNVMEEVRLSVVNVMESARTAGYGKLTFATQTGGSK